MSEWHNCTPALAHGCLWICKPSHIKQKKPIPELVKEPCGVEREHALTRPSGCASICVRRRKKRGEVEPGRWERQEAVHIILHASFGWSPPGIMTHSAKQQWKRQRFIHISIFSRFFPPLSIQQAALCPRLAAHQADTWSPRDALSKLNTPPSRRGKRHL